MRRVSAETLARAMASALREREMPEEHVGWVVQALVETSLRGGDNHGVSLFPTYLQELDGGRSRARPTFRWRRESRSAELLDAGDALGTVAAMAATRRCTELALQNGTGAVAVARSNHFGAASVYTLAMARRDLIGLCFSNSDALVAPVGGHRPVLGTNPLSFAVAGEGDDLFCVDMATSQVSFSRVRAQLAAGGGMEAGWVVDEQGRDPAMVDGAGESLSLQPLGGHKGQCLGLMVEVLCALLAGMPFDHELTNLFNPPWDQPRRISHFLLAIDVAAFQDATELRSRLSTLLSVLRQSGGVAPGDLERAAAAERRQLGIPLPPDLLEFFESLDG